MLIANPERRIHPIHGDDQGNQHEPERPGKDFGAPRRPALIPRTPPSAAIDTGGSHISPNAPIPRPVEETFEIHRTAIDFFKIFAGVPPNVLIGIPITS